MEQTQIQIQIKGEPPVFKEEVKKCSLNANCSLCSPLQFPF